MPELKFGVSIAPTVDIESNRLLVAAAEGAGLDLVGVQDHPYVPDFLDSFMLIGDLLARTERLQFFPDVANLPLRPAPMLARTSSALSRLCGGRFHLGLGAGGYWDAITSFGVERRTSADALRAQEEAMVLLRRLWEPRQTVTAHGAWYTVDGLASQPPAPSGIEIWVGAQGPRSLQMTGRLADGWAAPIPAYLPYERWAGSNLIIDRAAADAGRSPGEIRRLAQVVGTVTAQSGSIPELTGADPIRTDATGWAGLLTRLGEEHGFDGFILWPERATTDQIRRFGEEVLPGVRARLAG